MSNIAEINQEFLIEREGKYPPHHVGLHLEEYFLKFWTDNGPNNSSRKLIPIHWTSVYNYKSKDGLGPNTPNGNLRNRLKNYLSSLDPKGKYFVVSTHDDAPAEELPPDTQVFAAGGNSKKIDVHIPLICSPHTSINDHLRTIPISFVGSLTHPIRKRMVDILHQKQGVFLGVSEWSPEISKEKLELFKNVTERSVFSLCPRGYGASSFRLYESMQLGAIPIYLSDKHLLPWSDEIDWSKFSFVLRPNEDILSSVLSVTQSQSERMRDCARKTWENYFTIESTCKNIIKRIKD